MTALLRWDIFCRVIDNFGDIGVCWRLAADLAQRGQQVRLWVDDARALAWMAPQVAAGTSPVQVLDWPDAPLPGGTGDVVVEAFGCEVAPEFIAACADGTSAGSQKPCIINLEYLSAETYVERSHALPSPIQHGPLAGQVRWFFYPGFTPRTGGLLRERDLLQRQARFDRTAWRAAHGVAADSLAVALFCYEPPGLAALLAALAQKSGAQLLVTPGRASGAVQQALQAVHGVPGALSIVPLAHCAQPAFDELLWACDLNLVRGEDSLVRALWAGQPFVWQIYPQHDNAHHAKLQAFLDWLDAPASLRDFHTGWNGVRPASALAPLDAPTLAAWRDCAAQARARLLAQPDLATQLHRFACEKARI